MSVYTYSKIVAAAKTCTKNVNNKHNTGISNKWCYYFSKALISQNTAVKTISINDTGKLDGDYLSRQISKADILDCAKKVIKFVESKKKLPYGVTWGKYKINTKLFTYILASTLVYYDKNKKLPATRNVNSKVFTKPTETGNKVYDYACKKFGKKFKTMDEILEYVANHFTYQFYYDDKKSNKQVTDSKSGNCTDLLQWLINMLEALGYEWKVLHVQCSSGVGHVRGMFKHKKYTENTWVYRDIAAVADGDGIRTNWCFSGFTLLSTNPSWFLENLRR